MSEKSIKHKRVESYFIEAAKDIIKSNGPQAVSVRKIADLSGYSYGSIYNYYNDLDELLFHVKNSMIQDMIISMSNTESVPRSIEDIQVINWTFAQYFMENPHIYEFFYNYPIKTDGPTPTEENSFNENKLLAYQHFVETEIIKKEDLETVYLTILSSLYGLLNLYFSSSGITEKYVHDGLNKIIEFTLRRK